MPVAWQPDLLHLDVLGFHAGLIEPLGEAVIVDAVVAPSPTMKSTGMDCRFFSFRAGSACT